MSIGDDGVGRAEGRRLPDVGASTPSTGAAGEGRVSRGTDAGCRSRRRGCLRIRPRSTGGVRLIVVRLGTRRGWRLLRCKAGRTRGRGVSRSRSSRRRLGRRCRLRTEAGRAGTTSRSRARRSTTGGPRSRRGRRGVGRCGTRRTWCRRWGEPGGVGAGSPTVGGRSSSSCVGRARGAADRGSGARRRGRSGDRWTRREGRAGTNAARGRRRRSGRTR